MESNSYRMEAVSLNKGMQYASFSRGSCLHETLLATFYCRPFSWFFFIKFISRTKNNIFLNGKACIVLSMHKTWQEQRY